MQPHSGAWAFMSLAGFVGATSDAATSAWTRLPGGSPAKKHRREVFTVLLYSNVCSITDGVMDTPICDPEFLARQETSRQAFDALIHAHDQLLAAEVAELVTITHTADLWQVDTAAVDAGIEQLIQPGHDGTPQVGEFLALELGPVLGISPQAAISRIGNALDL